MNRVTKYQIVVLFFALLSFSFTAAPRRIKIYLIGDSTMSVKSKNNYPETGWGMPFSGFFDEGVQIDNRAQNGRSTKSFITEKRWQSVLDSLKEGDYVLIQFGHNDEVETKATYTKPEDFKANLTKFIAETRAKKANPILLSPVSRRQFSSAGVAVQTHPYSPLVREVATTQSVAFIDLDAKSMALYQQLGEKASALLFNHLAPGLHPNYPNGKSDDTHFNELGAREVAQLVLKEIRSLDKNLASHIRERK